MVAVVAVRLDRICVFGMLYLFNGPNWCDISYRFPGCCTIVIRNLGFAMACLQSRSYGVYLVRGAGLDRWPLCQTHDSVYLAVVQRYSQHDGRFWHSDQ